MIKYDEKFFQIEFNFKSKTYNRTKYGSVTKFFDSIKKL